jgi:DNA-binding LacI/PurR family transcriptional regulator
MYLEANHLMFKTNRKIICVDGMYNISENGVFRTLGYDQVVQEHRLSSKEKQEVIEDLQSKIDNLKMLTPGSSL